MPLFSGSRDQSTIRRQKTSHRLSSPLNPPFDRNKMPPKISDLATDDEVRMLSCLDEEQWLDLEAS
jgi:hypothetical protein